MNQRDRTFNSIAVMAGLIVMLWPLPVLPRGESFPPPAGPCESKPGYFIVAFELSRERGELTWPAPAQPYSGDKVFLMVEQMPRVLDAAGNLTELKVPGHLLINGRPPGKPCSVPPGSKDRRQPERQYLLVKLEQGRLRLALNLPPGVNPDPRFSTATISLYQVAE